MDLANTQQHQQGTHRHVVRYILDRTMYYRIFIYIEGSVINCVFFHPADPRGIMQGGLPGIPTQL